MVAISMLRWILSLVTLFDLGGLQDELKELLGVPVDLLTPGDLPLGVLKAVLAEPHPV